MYGILFNDGHVELYKTFDDAWNHSIGNIETYGIALVNVRNDGTIEIIDQLINL